MGFKSMVWCSVRYECVFNFRKTFYVYIIKFQCTTNSNYIAQYFLFMLRILDWSKDIKNNVHMESIFLKALILFTSREAARSREGVVSSLPGIRRHLLLLASQLGYFWYLGHI